MLVNLPKPQTNATAMAADVPSNTTAFHVWQLFCFSHFFLRCPAPPAARPHGSQADWLMVIFRNLGRSDLCKLPTLLPLLLQPASSMRTEAARAICLKRSGPQLPSLACDLPSPRVRARPKWIPPYQRLTITNTSWVQTWSSGPGPVPGDFAKALRSRRDSGALPALSQLRPLSVFNAVG